MKKCLQCEKPALDGRLGLCASHYAQANRAINAYPPERRAEARRRLIEKGLIRAPSKNAFAEFLEESMGPAGVEEIRKAAEKAKHRP